MPDPMVPERTEVVVVGGGIAGLSAAWELRDRDVVVLEAEPRIGGRLMSEPRGPYWLNFGGHLVGGPETATGRLLQATGVEAAELPGVLGGLVLGGRLLAGGQTQAAGAPPEDSGRRRLSTSWLRDHYGVTRSRTAAANRSPRSA